MAVYITDTTKVSIDDNNIVYANIARLIGCKASKILSASLYKQSIDARRKDNVHYVCRYLVQVQDGTKVSKCTPYTPPNNVLDTTHKVDNQQHIVVVGSGPCGLMCARLLSQCGHSVTVVERGSDIDKRQIDVANFFAGGNLDTNSNVQFGLGGAGTFSDGKLTTGTNSPLIYSVFSELVRAGAPDSIMYSNTPHIGTDRLVGVVGNIRDSISSCGGMWMFDTTLVDIVTDNGRVTAVTVRDNATNNVQNIQCDNVVLAIGHSARDTISMLDKYIDIAPKPFAMGVRVEHPRQFVSVSQYGQLALTHRDLMSANYKMAVNLDNGRNCYTFCMCPGGTVVAGSSESDTIVVNGMSNFDRMADYSNSALVVGVKVDDYYQDSPLDGIAYQRKYEQLAHSTVNESGSYRAPCQNVVDFVNKVPSTQLHMQSSYPCGTVPCNLWDILPQYMCESIRDGLIAFDKKIAGFGSSGILLAVESRTSSPVKIVRDDNLASVSCSNLYPAGEGAGYAGGIVSAGVDGLRVACKILGIEY